MIERAEISQVLAQIRATQGQMSGPKPVGGPLVQGLHEGPASVSEAGKTVTEVPSFATLLKQAIDGVNKQQLESSDLRTRYELGDPDVDLVSVMISSQKASVSFEAMSQVRSRLVTAYQEIMRMPI